MESDFVLIDGALSDAWLALESDHILSKIFKDEHSSIHTVYAISPTV